MTPHAPPPHEPRSSASRVALAGLVSVLVIAYTVSVISGFIPEGRKIDAVNLAIIAVAVLVVVFLMRPDVFDRLKILELSGVRLEMLEKVKEKQAKQEG